MKRKIPAHFVRYQEAEHTFSIEYYQVEYPYVKLKNCMHGTSEQFLLVVVNVHPYLNPSKIQ